MNTLEYGKFIKIFCRIKKEDGTLIRVPHSNIRGYSKKDVAGLLPKISTSFLTNWEKYLSDVKASEDWKNEAEDWRHFLYKLNSIDKDTICKYNLPSDYIIV
jgi:formylmethanofuran dehydrogenase subunit E